MGIQLQLSNLNFLKLSSCNRTVSLRAHQSSALNWLLLIVVCPLFATRTKYVCDVLSIGKKQVHVYYTFSHFVIDMINW